MIVIYLIKDTSMLRSLILVTSIRSVNCYIPLIITFGNYHLSQSAETHTLFSTLPSTIQLENNVKRDQADNQVRSWHFINEKSIQNQVPKNLEVDDVLVLISLECHRFV